VRINELDIGADAFRSHSRAGVRGSPSPAPRSVAYHPSWSPAASRRQFLLHPRTRRLRMNAQLAGEHSRHPDAAPDGRECPASHRGAVQLVAGGHHARIVRRGKGTLLRPTRLAAANLTIMPGHRGMVTHLAPQRQGPPRCLDPLTTTPVARSRVHGAGPPTPTRSLGRNELQLPCLTRTSAPTTALCPSRRLAVSPGVARPRQAKPARK